MPSECRRSNLWIGNQSAYINIVDIGEANRSGGGVDELGVGMVEER